MIKNQNNKQEEQKDKKSKFLIIAIPFFAIISLALSILLYIKIGEKIKENNKQERIVSSIDFSQSGVTFNDDFIFVSGNDEAPNILVDQGLALSEVSDHIKIKTPQEKTSIFLKIIFNDYQLKPTILNNNNKKNYKIETQTNSLNSLLFEFNSNPNEEIISPIFDIQNVHYLLFSLQNPYFFINNSENTGFLYIKQLILSEIY